MIYKLRPMFRTREFGQIVIKPSVEYEVNSLSQHCMGGMLKADITARGEIDELAEYFDYLRTDVTIWDDASRLAWWGYVNEFKIITKGKEAEIYCNGWRETLNWRTYLNTASGNTETTAQISAIITNMGQFFTGVDVETASGISSAQLRDGDRTGWEEIEDLLKSGTSANRRLLAEVTDSRRLHIYEEPDSDDVSMMIEGDVVIGASLDTMINKTWAWWSSPGQSDRRNTATVTDAESAAEYGTKSAALTLSAASETQAKEYRDAELARRKFPIPRIDIDGINGRVRHRGGGAVIPGYLVPAGVWLEVKDVIPSSANTAYLADMSRIFVEEIEWHRTRGIRITPRDVPGRYGEW
jgi:hypothetical protein